MIPSRRSTLAACMAILAAGAPRPTPLVGQAPLGVVATAQEVERITLSDALARLEAGNLELRMAQHAAAAADARATSAGAAPNPVAALNREQLSGASGEYHETIFTLGQILEIAGQRGLRQQTARSSARAAAARVDAVRLRLAFELRAAYVRAAAAEADLGILEEATQVFRAVEEAGRARLAEGDVSRFQLNRLQIERARYEALLGRAALDLDQASRQLTLLAQTAPEAGSRQLLLPAERLPDIAPGGSPATLEDVLSFAAARAEVVAAEAEMEAAVANVRLQQRMRVPAPTLGAGFKRQADGFQGAVVTLSVPVPIWDRNRGGINEAQAELAMAVAGRDLALRRAEDEIRRAWELRRAAQDRLGLVGEFLLAEAAGLLDTALIAYAEGELSLIELLDAVDAHRSARETATLLHAEYLSATYRLEHAVGRFLDAAPAAPAASDGGNDG